MLLKNLFRRIGSSFGRYFSIVAIVFIGTGFFAGLASTPPGMVKSADTYYAGTNLMHFKIVSSMGLTDRDIQTLRNTDGVQAVTPSYSLDVLDHGTAIGLHALEDDVNSYVLKSGRAPKSEGECIADDRTHRVGDTIDVTSDTGTKLKNKTFTVVGTLQSPLYCSVDSYGTTTIGDGKLHSFAFVPRSNFTMDVYTEAYVRGTSMSAVDAYSDAYTDAEKDLNQALVALAPSREKARYDEIYAKASNTIAKNQKKLDDKKAEGEKKLADAKSKLDEGSDQLAAGKAKLASGEAALLRTKRDKDAMFASAKARIAEGWGQVDEVCARAGASRSNVGSKAAQLKTAIGQMQAQLESIPTTAPQHAQLQAQIAQYQQAYAGLLRLESSVKTLSAQEAKLKEGFATYQKGMAQGRAQLRAGRDALRANGTKLKNGYADYQRGADTLETKFADAQKKLDDGRRKLREIKQPEWHVFDRGEIAGYSAFHSATQLITAITKAFPIFFVMIAMLMISNAMARMIVEERSELGTLTSLGYGTASIIGMYLLYVLSASVLGVVSGYFVGCTVIPRLISAAFGSRFIQPPTTLYYNLEMLGLILAAVAVVMVGVTVATCYAELRQRPAALMRPAPPKGGQRILLERITPLWSRMSFTWKVTMRNLLRNQRRAFMILVGVSGCTALLLTGFGIRDSTGRVAEKQFGQIIRYDNMIVLKDEATATPPKLQVLLDKEGLQDPLLVRQESFTSAAGNRALEAYVIVPQSAENFRREYDLRDVNTHTPLALSDQGAIVSDQFAHLHNVGVGGIVTIKGADEKVHAVPVVGVTENYLMHYLYMTPAGYSRFMKSPLAYNAIVARHGRNTPGPTELANRLMKDKSVLTVANNQDAFEQATSLNQTIDKIVILLVVVAGLLALVVLYNLTSINISERTREVATLKVLGFTTRETNSYIYREAFMLTLVAIIIGFALGYALHGFAVGLISNEGIGIVRTVLPLSYLYSAAIVVAIALVMQAVTHFKLAQIDMIDSLKSVE